jgi:hypothetical protein
MKPLLRKYLTISVGLALGVGFALLARPYFWPRLGKAKVRLDGQPNKLAAIYRSYNGNLLLWLQEPEGETLYIVKLSTRRVVVPSERAFLRNSRFAWSKSARPSGVDLTSAKAEVDQHVIVQDAYSEFTSLNSHRVRIDY